ncbi:hypothetical protein GWK47_040036 [Chionoecetes opilio]|uniref:Reverse transcriptase domain-containing protein n=1 Tax=Chionoecetes opilio TaxID=41210 RepID=A0A8J4YDP9_CHIOP|nr:hypothetical protein GWK47_040036 [Chionoecetes opilio]
MTARTRLWVALDKRVPSQGVARRPSRKLRAKGIQGDLLLLLGKLPAGRTPRSSLTGRGPRVPPSGNISPTGLCAGGPVLWNIYVDDLLRQCQQSGYADDLPLSCSYPEDTDNDGFSVPCCRASSGTEAAVWWRSFPTPGSHQGYGSRGGPRRELRFDGHIKHIAKKASHRVSALRRVASFLDRGGKLLLYKAQIRPYLEYAALSWMSRAASYTRRLDSIQRRPLRVVEAADPPAQPEPVSPLVSLEHRRDVAALVVFHKAQGVPHLSGLQQPPRIATRSTITVLTSGDAVEVPRSHASQPTNANPLWAASPGVEHFHGRHPSHPGDEHTKCKVGGQSVETVKAHPADASDTVTLSDSNSTSTNTLVMHNAYT